MTQIKGIPCFKDNIIWAIIPPNCIEILIVDPGEASPVLAFLNDNQLVLGGILITHHHWDHTGGIVDLLKLYPEIPVYGPHQETIVGVKHPVKEGAGIHFPNMNLSFESLEIPGHTLGHVAYVGEGLLFSGDTLFSYGCGRVFEGTMEQMHRSLMKLAALDGSLLLCCGHEYTLANLDFAVHVEPQHAGLLQKHQEILNKIQSGQSSLPNLLNEEKRLNPFLRCHEDSLINAVVQHSNISNKTDPIEIFAALRNWKNTF